MAVVYDRVGVSMETNLFVYIISHITITGYKTKATTAIHAFKIHHKLSVVSSLNNACPYPEPALINPPEHMLYELHQSLSSPVCYRLRKWCDLRSEISILVLFSNGYLEFFIILLYYFLNYLCYGGPLFRILGCNMLAVIKTL